jgi:integrase
MATNKKREQDGVVSYQVRYRDAEGKERSKQFKKWKDAEAFRIKVESEVASGVHTPESTSVTVARAADLFLDGRKLRELERASIADLASHIENHIKPLLGTEKLATLTMPAVNDFAEALVRTGRSRVLAAKILVTFRSILRDAQKRGLVGQNVAVGVSVPVSTRVLDEEATVYVPTRKELRDILSTAEAKFPDFYPYVLTAVFTGLRSSELRGLRIVDIDLKGATISVRQRADKYGVIGAPKSKAGRRTIPVPPMLVSVLRAWILRAPKSDKGLAFPTSTGGVRLHGNTEKRQYWPLLVAAGVSEPTGKRSKRGKELMRGRFGIHCLRHAAASAWINGGVDLKRIQSWLGHSTIELTMDRYGHLMADDAADAAIARATEAALFG